MDVNFNHVVAICVTNHGTVLDSPWKMHTICTILAKMFKLNLIMRQIMGHYVRWLIWIFKNVSWQEIQAGDFARLRKTRRNNRRQFMIW
jgi:hypothetical protein